MAIVLSRGYRAAGLLPDAVPLTIWRTPRTSRRRASRKMPRALR